MTFNLRTIDSLTLSPSEENTCKICNFARQKRNRVLAVDLQSRNPTRISTSTMCTSKLMNSYVLYNIIL